jgi:hypothetical protein
MEGCSTAGGESGGSITGRSIIGGAGVWNRNCDCDGDS